MTQCFQCGNVLRPPSGCAQYFTGNAGTVQSFNWQGQIHITGQNYRSCLREELGKHPNVTFDS